MSATFGRMPHNRRVALPAPRPRAARGLDTSLSGRATGERVDGPHRPIEAALPRLAVLATATAVVQTISLVVTALGFTPASWPAFITGNLLVGLTYACIGALAGALLGQLGATYLMLFLAMLGIGILQNPMFGDGTPGGLAYVFPDYGAGRVIIDGAFSSGFHAWASSRSRPPGWRSSGLPSRSP